MPPASPYPPWLALVKRAIIVMSLLLVLGLGLLVYGLANQIGGLASNNPANTTLNIPLGLTLIATSVMPDGRVVLGFAPKHSDASNSSDSGDSGGGGQIIILSPDLRSISNRLNLIPHAGDFGISEE